MFREHEIKSAKYYSNQVKDKWIKLLSDRWTKSSVDAIEFCPGFVLLYPGRRGVAAPVRNGHVLSEADAPVAGAAPRRDV